MQKLENVPEELKALIESNSELNLEQVKISNKKRDISYQVDKFQDKLGIANLIWDIDENGHVVDFFSFNKEADKDEVEAIKNKALGIYTKLVSGGSDV